MPWGLLILIAGFVLRFGIEGYNTLGDILIIVGAVLTVLLWVFFAAILSSVGKNFR